MNLTCWSSDCRKLLKVGNLFPEWGTFSTTENWFLPRASVFFWIRSNSTKSKLLPFYESAFQNRDYTINIYYTELFIRALSNKNIEMKNLPYIKGWLSLFFALHKNILLLDTKKAYSVLSFKKRWHKCLGQAGFQPQTSDNFVYSV